MPALIGARLFSIFADGWLQIPERNGSGKCVSRGTKWIFRGETVVADPGAWVSGSDGLSGGFILTRNSNREVDQVVGKGFKIGLVNDLVVLTSK